MLSSFVRWYFSTFKSSKLFYYKGKVPKWSVLDSWPFSTWSEFSVTVIEKVPVVLLVESDNFSYYFSSSLENDELNSENSLSDP